MLGLVRKLIPSRRFDVAFYSPWLGPVLSPGADLPPGGAETQIFMLSRQIAARGYRVALIVYPTEAPLPERVGDIEVIVQRVPSTGLPILRTLEYGWGMLQALLVARPRVVVQRAAGSVTGLVAVVTRLLGARFVYSSANVIDFDFRRLETKRVSVALFHLGVRIANEVVVQTEEQAALCERVFGRTAHLIPSIVEPEAAAPEKPEAFLWIARLAPYKRPLEFVWLASALPDVRFWMVGVPIGDVGRELEEEVRAAASGLENLELLPPRPRADLLPLVERAVAIVNTAEYEGMPNVFLEGWARGVPAVSLFHDPDGVIEREGLGVFAAGSAERLVEQCRGLWEWRGDREVIAERCRSYVARAHSPAAVVPRWLRALKLAAGEQVRVAERADPQPGPG